ncbi:MAG: carboxylate-amine ligase [Acidobacteria bacterium]|nr:carboxylate-amine ligase [Acidobacteriota bacterium]
MLETSRGLEDTVTTTRPTFTVGVEEEYLIVDLETRNLVRDLPEGLLVACEEILGGQVRPEFLRSQIEVGTRVCTSISEVRRDLARLRSAIVEVSSEYGLAPIAASTHPFAIWGEQMHTDQERYNVLAKALGGVIRRLLICGMHVHVGIEDKNLRIDLMNQVLYFLPHLLAMSTSSPFWQGNDTGLKSYRTSVFRAVPRTGIPDEFGSWADYERHVDVLVDAGVIEDATKLWWDLRPSARYPTIEMRATDVCTTIDDAMAVAAMYQSLLFMLYELRVHNQRWRLYSRMLLSENTWRAQRYGVQESLIDFGRSSLVPYDQLMEEMIELVMPGAEELGCVDEILHVRTLIQRGTSADRQLTIFEDATSSGASDEEALVSVVDWLIKETANVK